MTERTAWTADGLADAMDDSPRCGGMCREEPVVQCPKCKRFVGESRTGSHASRCVKEVPRDA